MGQPGLAKDVAVSPPRLPLQSLKTRVTVFTLAVFLSGIWALAVYASRMLQGDMERLLGEQQFSVVSATASHLNRELTERLASLETIAKEVDSELIGHPAALQARLQQRPLLQLLFNGGAWFSQQDGIVVASNLPSLIGTNYADREYMIAVLKNGKSTISKPVTGKVLKDPIFVTAVPVRDAQGLVIGALAGVTDLSKPGFLDGYTQSPYGQTGGYFIIALQHRLVVTATDKSRVMQLLPAPGVNPVIDRFVSGYEGYGVLDNPAGVGVLSSSKLVPVAGWAVAASLPTAEAFEPIRNMRQRMFLAALFLTLLAGCLTWWILRRQLSPLIATAEALTALPSTNQIPSPLPVTSQDEIGQLTRSFNRLIETWTQRENALRKSEQDLAITLNSIGDAVIATDPSSRITGMNPTAERLCGWSLADAMGQGLAEVFHIIDAGTREPVADPVQMVMAHGQVVDLANHTLLLAKDGQEFHISDSAAPIRNREGEIVGVVLVFSDVTKRYRAEQALISSERRFRSYFDQPLVGIAITSPEKGWIEVNEHLCRMLGYSSDELVRLTWDELTHPDDLAADLVQFERVQGGEIDGYALDKRFIRKDRSVIPVFLSVRCVRDAHGAVDYFVALLQDISARKQSEEAAAELNRMISQLNQRFSLAADSAQIGVWDYFPSEDRLVWDKWMYALYGVREEDFSGAYQAWQTGLHPDDRARSEHELTMALSGEKKFDTEFRVVWPSADVHHIKAAAIVQRDPDGKPVRMTGVNYDISERKLREARQLLVSQRMEALLKLPAAAEGRNEAEFLQYGLEQVETLTGSQIASVHFVHDNEDSIELVTWSQATLKDYCHATFDRHYPISQAGIWADGLRQRKPVLVNDYANAIGKHGLPEGHAHLERLISVPVIEGGQVRMMLGVGNKPQHYSELDVETARLLAESLWRIASQRRAEAALRKSEERYRLMFDRAGDGIMILSLSGKLVAVNEAFARMHGCTTKEMSSLTLEDLDTPEGTRVAPDRMQRILDGESVTFEVEHYHKDGHVFPLEVSASLIVSEGESVIQAFHRDITERKKAEGQIQSLAFSDPLTGLPNRRLLMDRLEQAITAAARHGHQTALLFVDLDDFKTLNDTLGHDKGDMLLKQIAQRLIACVREGDTVARLSGDEFIVLLEDLSEDAQDAATQAQTVGGKILDALGQPYQLYGHGHHSTASIGVTLFGGTVRESIEEPLKRAELAMYQAKRAGRGTLRFFEPEMRTAVNTRATLEADLRQAVTRGQFFLYYQPQCSGDRNLLGVEALVRWQHPERGLVSPVEFIPVAETSGLILPLGRWVLRAACQQLATWAARPGMADLTMSVNVSAREFRQPDFVEEVVTILEATGADPMRLKLELTESVLVDNVEDIIAKMNALKALGVSFSLDDFGTGYSSLSYLKRLPLDQLKIDQGFVRDILTDPNDAAIAKMVVVLAATLGLTVIAEGVETEAQRWFLASTGCDNYQGFLFSRPLPIDEFEAFARGR